MTAKLLVLDELVDGYQGKTGRVETATVRGIETATAHNFGRVVDVAIDSEQRTSHFGKLKGKTVEVGITDTRGEWGGRLRVTGRLLTVDGKAA